MLIFAYWFISSSEKHTERGLAFRRSALLRAGATVSVADRAGRALSAWRDAGRSRSRSPGTALQVSWPEGVASRPDQLACEDHGVEDDEELPTGLPAAVRIVFGALPASRMRWRNATRLGMRRAVVRATM
jgi:hypothetical protein